MTLSVTARDQDTICALATAQGIGAISIIRLSGKDAVRIARRLSPFLPEAPQSHRVYYGILCKPQGEKVDEVLISYFAEGRSFTGESTCEISVHGSVSIVNEVLRLLVAEGARPAERGEFTYRAFMSGRLDLVQAESVLALIESRSPRASRLALGQLQGDFSKRLRVMREDLTWVLANLEANIDFAAEDIVVASADALASRIQKTLNDVRSLLASYAKGRIIRNGFQVALVGRPNAGKSSLLNVLAGEERAIVTEIAGTTRDFVEAQMMIEGLSCTLVDTAGLRETSDPVEKIGVQRTWEKMADVDLILYVVSAEEGETAAGAYAQSIPWQKTAVIVNKIDLLPESRFNFPQALQTLEISATTTQGIADLVNWLHARLKGEVSEDSTLVSNARHFHSLETLAGCLEKALPLVINEDSPDLIALELQTGLRALYEILGLVYDDQVMDRVFSEFCLGK